MNSLISQAIMLLSRNYLLDCVALVRQYAIENRKSQIRDVLDNIEQSYRFLLKYLAEGSNDPSREKLFCDLRYRLYALVRNLETEENASESPLLYFSTLRSLRYSHLTFSDALGRFLSVDSALQLTPIYNDNKQLTEEAKKLMTEKDRAMKDIFSVIWTLPVGERKQLEAIVNVSADADISFELRALIVAALTLSLLQTYDSEKLIALLDIESRSVDQRIRARALTGIVLSIALYAPLLQPDNKLDNRFEVWKDDLTNYPRLREVVYALVKTRGSERLANKINAELMPGIMGMNPDFLKNIQKEKGVINLEELQENPEWEKMMRESGLDKKLRKLHNIHSKGADMALGMFNQVSNHYFFKDIDSWFRPFEEWEGLRIGLDSDITSFIYNMPNFVSFCDTDKYALMLNLSRIPAVNRDMMKSAFQAGQNSMEEEMREEMKEFELRTTQPEFDREVVNYARILFRFFKYFRLRREFQNPFDKAIHFSSLPYLKDMLSEDEILHTVGETYFHQEYYDDAIEVYSELVKRDDQNSSMLYQKIGYCHEKANRPEKSLENYLLADNLRDGTDRWLTERIYSMAKRTNKGTIMLQALDSLLELDKDNIKYLEEWVQTMIELNVYKSYPISVPLFEKRLSKLIYLLPDEPQTLSLQMKAAALKEDYNKVIDLSEARRADIEMYLAASSLDTHKDDKANEEDKVDIEKTMANDLLLMANAHAALGKYSDAISDLKLLRMLRHAYSADDIQTIMNKQWSESEALSQHQIMIPMLVEASASTI